MSFWFTLRAVFAELFTIFNKFDEYKAELIFVSIPFIAKSPETVKSPEYILSTIYLFVVPLAILSTFKSVILLIIIFDVDFI